MKKNVLLALGTLAAAVAARLTLAQPAEDPLDPVRVAADTHRVALDNKFVRVLDVRLPPGKVEPRHRHPHGMSVYFTDWEAKVTPDGGATETRHRTAGTFAWSEAVIHTVQNAGATEGHILRIELKF
jgi:quercetin dioxygenase-like cupin family protein